MRYERGGFYAEGSMHAGRSTTSFNTAVRLAVVDYESKATYYGADAVLGYRFSFPCATLDLSVRYGWNRSKGDAVMVGANSVDLDAVNSHRLRAAGRWTAARTQVLNPFVGLAVDYEMDGKSSGHVYNYSLAQAKINGLTVMGEVGLHVGNQASRYSADVGIEGYLGKREGLAAKAMFGWTF